MNEDLIDFRLDKNTSKIIKVIGVGGCGGNAATYMYEEGVRDVEFIICNTDDQALKKSSIPNKIQLGPSLTMGRGAGSEPEVGKNAALENIAEIEDLLGTTMETSMVFITAGMGGGTGTGAAPIIAKTAKEKGILTVGIVTLPFEFEGKERINQALDGMEELQKYVDSLLIINNQKVMDMYSNLKRSEAYAKANDVLKIAAKSISDIITQPGETNVDFADVRKVMKDSQVSFMGAAIANGENRAQKAAQAALTSPLLRHGNIAGSKKILLCISSSSGDHEMTMEEINIITSFVRNQVVNDTHLIHGDAYDENLGDNISVTIIATGFETKTVEEIQLQNKLSGRSKGGFGRSKAIDLDELAKAKEQRINIFYGSGENKDIQRRIWKSLTYEQMEDDNIILFLEENSACSRSNNF